MTALAVVTAVCFFSPSATSVAVSPIEKAVRFVRVQVFSRIGGCFRGAQASAENVRLRREVASLSLLVGEVERLEAENERLRRTLGYHERHSQEWLPAEVLSAAGGAVASGDVLRVDKGSDDGVLEGAVVMVPDGLVGKVIEVTAHTAKVQLITDPRTMVSCTVATPGGEVRAVLVGGSDERLFLKYLNSPDALPLNSKVVTSGRGGVFPGGIAVGDYRGVGGQGMPEVCPAVDFNELEDVFIRREK